MAEHRDVHLWLHHPSPALWDAVTEAHELPGRRRDQHPVVRNPLLASMSRDVRELQQLLNDVPHGDEHHPIGQRPATLLGRLQDDLAHDRVREAKTALEATDTSLRVHAAHGPARQVEVVREVILGLLEEDPTLEPRDILIMCPDVETFAPLVAASFGMTDEPGGHPAARLRVKLADRSLRQTNPLLDLLSKLLELAASRVTATQVLDLAGVGPVRRRFGFDEDDLERLRDWTVSAGARWGLDANHRGDYGLSGIGQNTWRVAIDRLLLGVAMEDDAAWVGETLPLDDVDSGDIDLAGRFAELFDRVDDAVRTLGEKRPVRDWARTLDELVRSLGEAAEAWQTMQLRRELDEVADSAAGIDVELGLADVTALLRSRLAGRPTRASFRTGTLTVCTLVPMRSVPHRVVCLLGMDDGAFPRQGVADGDDILAREPRSGERDVRSEDRQLFLDAICAAQEHLVIAYTGADPRSGAEVPPCVPLGELLDAVDATAVAPGGGPAREHVVVRHPLQPFDRRNFLPDRLGTNGSFSFDPAGLAGARSADRPRTAVPPLVSAALAPAPYDATVNLEDLLRFLQHPVRGFLRQRLDISTAVGEDDPDDAITVELDGLQNWAIGDRVLRRCLAGTPRDTAAHLEYLRGELPPGPLGAQAMRAIGSRVDALLHASELERRDRGVVGGGNSPARGRAGPVRDGARRTGVDHPERHLFDPRPETSPQPRGCDTSRRSRPPRTLDGAPSPSGAAARQRAGRSFTGSNRRSRDSSSTCSSASATPGCASRCHSPSRHPRRTRPAGNGAHPSATRCPAPSSCGRQTPTPPNGTNPSTSLSSAPTRRSRDSPPRSRSPLRASRASRPGSARSPDSCGHRCWRQKWTYCRDRRQLRPAG